MVTPICTIKDYTYCFNPYDAAGKVCQYKMMQNPEK